MRPPLVLAALLGGLGALATQIVYTRRLALLFGVTSTAAATVVAVYLAGMAVGAGLGGRLADRAGARAWGVYVVAEAGSAVWALGFPWLFAWADPLVAGLDADHTWLASVGLTALLVGPGAVLSGATFPALARVSGSVRDVGRLYALNAAGAAVGALVAGLFLPDRIGLLGTLYAAVGASLFAAAVVAGFGRGGGRAAPVEAASADPAPPRAAMLSLSLLGAVGMTAEIGWTRLLEQTGPNAGALCFPLVLAAYLVGLLVGGTWGVGWLRGAGDRRALARCLLVAGGATAAGLGALRLLPPESIEGHIVGLGLANDRIWHVAGIYVTADRRAGYLLATALPGCASGAGFPLAAASLSAGSHRIGLPVGVASATGILAGVVASVWLGLMPTWGPGVVRLLAGVALVAALAAAWIGRRPVYVLGVPLIGLALLVPPWAGLQIPHGEHVEQFVESASGPSAITSGDGVRVYTHGERVGGLTLDLAVPMALHPRPTRVLDIAFGTGVNAVRFAQDPDIADLTVVDIDPVLPTLAAHNPLVGPGLFDGVRVKYAVDDGRRLLRQDQPDYDVIYSDVATYAQYAELGTVEFFGHVRDRLAPGGLFALKLHLNTLTDVGTRRFLAGVVQVFPQSWVFAERGPITVLVATDAPAPVETLRERWARVASVYGPELERSLAQRVLLGPAEVAAWAEGPPQTDDRRTPWPRMLVGPFNARDPQATGLPALYLHAAQATGAVYPGLDPRWRVIPPPARTSGEVAVPGRPGLLAWWRGEVAPTAPGPASPERRRSPRGR